MGGAVLGVEYRTDAFSKNQVRKEVPTEKKEQGTRRGSRCRDSPPAWGSVCGNRHLKGLAEG